jgi:hypothetical protein
VNAQRKAKNEALFREVNERIEDVAGEFRVPGEATFVCECGDASCTEMVSLTLTEYEHVRSRGTHFAILPGHQDATVERVVAETNRFAVVEKTGAAGHVADALDPRDD